MRHQLLSFQEALRLSANQNKRHLLTGNGFSIACRSNIFRYDSLFEQADFSALNPNIKKVFEVLDTKDFEVVMRYLHNSIEILRIYAPETKELLKELTQDADALKDVLVNAIASSHPEHPSKISDAEYSKCKTFLSNFQDIYTLNYDLLLYWTFMHYQNAREIISDDGFRTPETGKEDYVSWDIEKTNRQNLFYLHGALHLFDARAELKKFTWINTGVKLIDQIRVALNNGFYPLIVSEGKSIEKVEKIVHSNYLSRGMRSFSSIGCCLFIYGHSLAINDSHILNLIPKTKIKQLFVSLYGGITDKANQEIILTAERLVAQRRGKPPIELHFYNSETANVWN